MKLLAIVTTLGLLVASPVMAQSDQALSGHEVELLKSEGGVDLCFLPVETVYGAQVHIIDESYVNVSRSVELASPKTISVTVEDTGEPIVLFVRFMASARTERIWKFDIEADANVVGVHFLSRFSKILPRMEGLPEGMPITFQYHVNGESNDCVFQPAMDPALAAYGPDQIAPNSFSGIPFIALGFGKLEEDLKRYAAMSMEAYQRTEGGWFDSSVTINSHTAQDFIDLKAREQLLLDQAQPPELPFLPETAETLTVPEGLARGEVWPWIIAHGYAMKAPPELIGYRCDIDQFIAFSMGLEVPKTAYCRWTIDGTPNGESRFLLLLGSVEMSTETCESSAYSSSKIFGRDGIVIESENFNCRSGIMDINKKTWY
ncbi:MAG: hypothetical protein COB08_004030 [Rhodobacteraceae bacterium]|nr:hypothetical protein [Paracoccaceae bacterium]